MVLAADQGGEWCGLDPGGGNHGDVACFTAARRAAMEAARQAALQEALSQVPALPARTEAVVALLVGEVTHSGCARTPAQGRPAMALLT